MTFKVNKGQRQWQWFYLTGHIRFKEVTWPSTRPFRR